MRKYAFLVCLWIIAFANSQETQPTVDPLKETAQRQKVMVRELAKEEIEALKKSIDLNKKQDNKVDTYEPLTRTTINPSTTTQATGTSDEVGVTAGNLSVSLTGGAVYNVPIYVPPGINGVEPKISLAYNSQGGNGMAGWGWNITGLSSITRVPANMFYDNRVGGVNLNMQDRFALDGQRLLLKDPSQTYGAANTLYVTESHSNILVRAYGLDANGQIDSFTVYYPDGSIANYGNGTTAAPAKSRTEWSLTTFMNKRGLRIQYNYALTDNILRVTSIAYGHLGPSTPINNIYFDYVNRARPEQYFIGGISFVNQFLLDKIRIVGSGTPIKNYNLTYDTTSLNYQRLERITERNGDNSLSLNPTVFEYEHTTTDNMFDPTGEDYLYLQNVQSNNSGYISGDFNGSGNTQVAIYPTTGADAKKKLWYYNDLTGGNNLPFTYDFPQAFDEIFSANIINHQDKMLPYTCFGTVNKAYGEELTHFKLYTHGGVFLNLMTHRSYNFPRLTTNNDCERLYHCDIMPEPDQPLPFKNDEILEKLRTDVIIDPGNGFPIDPTNPIYTCDVPNNLRIMGVYGDQATIHWYQQPNSATQTYEVHYINASTGTPPSNTDPIGTYQLINQNWITVFNLDLNNDYSFYVRRICQSTQGLLSSDWIGPVSTSSAINNVSYTDVPKKFISGDFNGDGITDMIAVEQPTSYPKYICDFSNNCYTDEWVNHEAGTAYFINLDRRLPENNFVFPAGQIHFTYKIEVGDFNGNGKSDLFVFDTGMVRVYELNDQGIFQLLTDFSHGHIKTNTELLFGDYNGDGKTDMLIPQSEATAENQTSLWTFFMSNGLNFNTFDKTSGVDFPNYQKAQVLPYHFSPFYLEALREFIYLPIDINNDGKTDLIYLNNFSEYRRDNTNYDFNGRPLGTGWRSYTNLEFNSNNATFVDNGLVYFYELFRKHPIPVFINHRNPYKIGQMAILSNDKIRTYDFTKNNQIDTALRKITLGNGVEEAITYNPLLPGTPNSFPFVDPTYQTADLIHSYPYYGLAAAPSFLVVSELQRKSMTDNHYLKQRYRYYGAISRMDGLGFQGFQATTSTNWFTDADMKIFTNHKKFDATLRGAMIEDLTEWGIRHPNPNLSVSQFVSKTTINYESFLSSNKVYTLRNTTQTSFDGLLNTSKTTSYDRYDIYNNPREVYETVFNNNILEKSVMTYLSYENNVGSYASYYIGRPKTKTIEKRRFLHTDANVLLTEGEEIIYHLNGLPETIRKKGHNTDWVTENNQFDLYGNITQKTITANGVSRITTFEYDTSNRFVKKSTNVEGLHTNYTFYQPTGLLHIETTPYGLSITNQYDSWGKKTQVTDYLGNQNLLSYMWLNNRRTTRVTSNLADGNQTIEDRDDLNRVTDTYNRNLEGVNVMVRQDYDYLNQVLRKSEPTTDTPKEWTTFDYDIYGRPTKVIMPSTREIKTQYNDLTTTVNDGVMITEVTKNASGLERTKIEQKLDNTTLNTLTFNYDANDHLTSTNFGNHTVTISYDNWGRKQNLNDPSAGLYSYTYNDFGETLTEVTPNGTTTYNYAPTTGKLNSKTVTSTNSSTNSVSTYIYNEDKLLDNMIFVDNSQTPTRTTTYTYAYDTRKRLETATETTPDAVFQKTLFYDNLGRNHQEHIKVTHTATGQSAEKTIRTEYQNGQFKTLRDVSTNIALYTINTINAYNQVLTAGFGNNLNILNDYTPLGFLINSGTTNASNVNVLNLYTTFDEQRGNLNYRHSSLFRNSGESFTYDDLDRLTHYPRYNDGGRVMINSQQDYQNDGRITVNAAGSYDYNARSSRYRHSQLRINTNDNPYPVLNTREQSVTYHVNKSPNTITVNEPSQTNQKRDFIKFYNNDMGSRSRVDFQASGRQKYYSADGSAEITGLANGQVEIAIFLGGDAYTAPAVHQTIFQAGDSILSQQILYLHRDYLGSIVGVSEQSGAIIEKRHFDAWGQLSHYWRLGGSGNYQTLPDGINTFLFLDRGYTGHEHLLSVGLVHMNGRLYDPILHRFLQPDNFVQDPLNSQNYNRYGYCWNNPLKFSDPSGEIIWFVPLIYAAVNLGVDLAMNNGKMNFGQIAMSLGQGALSGVLGGATSVGGAFLGAGIGQLNRFMPAIPIYQSSGFNLSISPFIGFGTSGFASGVSLNASGQIGDFAYSASVGFGSNSGASSLGEAMGASNFWNAGGFAGYNDGHANYGLGYSYNSFGGKMGQGVGSANIQVGDFGFSFINDILGDGQDRGRTAAIQMSYKVNDDMTLVAGLSMMTGQANGKGIKGGNPNIPLGMHNPNTERMPTLRSGTLYGGAVYKGQATFYGHNSERRLHGVQNTIHRNWPIYTTEYFPDRGLPSRGYGYSGSYHSNYLYF